MKLYKLCVPNAMKEHIFTDDVAICWAWSKKGAIKKFRKLYSYSNSIMELCVHKIHFSKLGIAILTSY